MWPLTLRKEHKLQPFENKMIWKILISNKDEGSDPFWMLLNGKLRDLFMSPSIVKLVKSRRLRWAQYVAEWGKQEMYTEFWWVNRFENVPVEDRERCGRNIGRFLNYKFMFLIFTSLDEMQRSKILNCMVVSIPRIQPALILFMNVISICYCNFQTV
jgi:hypothetical protein